MWLFFVFLVNLSGSDLISKPVHTYSIVAYDAATGEVGGAVQSHWFNVGSLVIWAEPGVGAVATQSFVNPDFGPWGLAALAKGETPTAALSRLVAADQGREVRQVAMVDVKGGVAAHTGSKCIDYACDRQGSSYSVQANIMLKDSVCAAMARAYEASAGKPLAERLLAALQAAQAEGGDLRGKQSSAIKVVKAKASDKPWLDLVVELRVEDHPDPVNELARLLSVSKAYNYMNEGDLQLEKNQTELAQQTYEKAVALLPGRVEPLFWQAVNWANLGKEEQAFQLFRKVFASAPEWRAMPDRLLKVGLLKDKDQVERIKKIE